jgi:hypothetical protein
VAKTPLEQRLFAELLGCFLRLVGVQSHVLGGGPHAGFETARADLRNRIFHNEKKPCSYKGCQQHRACPGGSHVGAPWLVFSSLKKFRRGYALRPALSRFDASFPSFTFWSPKQFQAQA